MTKNEIVELLKQREVLVEFVKRDGSLRKMLCTLKTEDLPAVSHSSIIPPKDHLLTVWDLGVKDWRTLNFTQQVRVLL